MYIARHACPQELARPCDANTKSVRYPTIRIMLTFKSAIHINITRAASVNDPSETVVITLEHGPLSIANALRRIMLSEVRSPALCDIEMLGNRSQMNSGMLANRLALVPIRGERTSALRSPCDCKDGHCRHCAVEMQFDVMGPGSMTERHLVMAATADDKRDENDDDLRRKRSRTTAVAVEPVPYGGIEIHRLGRNERVQGRAWVKLGTHMQHAKFACVRAQSALGSIGAGPYSFFCM